MLNKITIAKKLPALFAIMTTLSVVIVGLLSYLETSRAIQRDVFAKLKSVEQTIGKSMDTSFARIEADLNVIAGTSMTEDAFTRLGAGFENIRREGKDPKEFLQNSYIRNNPYPESERHMADSIDDGSYYSKFHGKYHDWFKTMLIEYGYHDIFLVSPKGDVVYSVFKERDFAENINSNALRGSGLSVAVAKAASAEIGLTDFQPYVMSNGKLAAFIAREVKDQYDEAIGTLVLQLDPAPFKAIISDDAGFEGATRAFVLGADGNVKFSHGVAENSPAASGDYFQNTDLLKSLSSGVSGVEIVTDSQTGQRLVAAYGLHPHHGVDMGLIWQVDFDDAMAAVTSLRNKIALVAIITMLVVAVLGLLLARSISNPLTALQKGLQRFVASGDLTIRVGTDAKDEVGSSTRAVDEILEMTQRTLIGIKDGNDTASEAAEKMMSAAKVMATNAEVQSSSVEELSSSVEETESQVLSNANAAKEANDLVVGTSAIVQDGKEKINRMVDSMDRIKASSEDIAKIIKVIDEIAFQTNLLALNAAVEAARAGQHGRGFAVVAAEVRNLAGRSAKAAQETSELIVGSSKRVEAGVEVSSQAREAFDKIADDISQVTDLVGKITMASDEQARGVTYINRAIQEISDAAMTNAVRAEELTVVADELSTSNDMVRRQISQFELGAAANRNRRPAAKPAAKSAPAKQAASEKKTEASKVDYDERGFGRY